MTKLTDTRIAWLCRQLDRGFVGDSLGGMAARWGVTKRRLRQVLQLYRRTGVVPTLNPRRRPPAPPLTEEEKRVITEEWQRTRRGATKIWKALARRGIDIPKMKIYRYARSQRWARPNPRKQKRRSYIRYEREHSGSLVHGDWHRTSPDHPYVILWEDDASRKILSGGEFDAVSAEQSIATLRAAQMEAASWGLTIREANTDRGSEFFCVEKDLHRPGVSQFQRYLQEQGIHHAVSGVRHPQTNGKLERLWHEYDKQRWRFPTLQAFIDWNNAQIHDSLWTEVYETPQEAFVRKLPTELLLGLHMRQVEAQA